MLNLYMTLGSHIVLLGLVFIFFIKKENGHNVVKTTTII